MTDMDQIASLVTDEIVETAAQAIFALRQKREPLCDWNEQFVSAKSGYLRDARAALLAVAPALNTALAGRLAEAEAQRDEAIKAVKLVQNASRTLDHSRQEVIHQLQKPIHEERLAAATLDSEREANALLTDELDTLRSEQNALSELLREAGEALKWFVADDRFQVAVGGNPIVVEKMISDSRAILAKIEALKESAP